MPDDFEYDIFLRHNHADKPRVRWLAPVSQLSTLNSQPAFDRLDEWVIQAGDIIALKVDEGLEQSRVLLLLSVSQLSTLNSQPSAALERSTAVHRDPANAGRRFIPLLVGDSALPDTLRRYKVARRGRLFYSAQIREMFQKATCYER